MAPARPSALPGGQRRAVATEDSVSGARRLLEAEEGVERSLRRAADLPQATRASLVQWCKNELTVRKNAKGRRARAARILMALAPDSWGAIQELLAMKSEAWHYDVHFAVFLYFGELRGLCGRKFDEELLQEIGDYLQRTSRGEPAFYAADAIVFHWPARAAIKALVDAVRASRFVAARIEALMQLEAWVHSGRAHERDMTRRALRMGLNDKSVRVRRCAARIWELHVRRHPRGHSQCWHLFKGSCVVRTPREAGWGL